MHHSKMRATWRYLKRVHFQARSIILKSPLKYLNKALMRGRRLQWPLSQGHFQALSIYQGP